MEGPNSIDLIYGFLHTNGGSVFAENNQSNRVYSVSDIGKIESIYQLFSFNDKFFSRPYPEDGVEMFYYNNHLYIPAAVGGINYDKQPRKCYSEGFLGIDLDLIEKKLVYQIPYPNKDILIDKAFVSQAIQPKCIVNPNSKELIYSFGADPNVYVYSLNGKLKASYLLNTSTGEVTKPMSDRQQLQDMTEEFLHYANNMCYEKLFYDIYRHYYYRIVKHKTSEVFTKK